MSLFRGLVVSCQPNLSQDAVLEIAVATVRGGAVGVRLNDPKTIWAFKERSSAPVIGLWKQIYPDSPVYITPTLKEVSALVEAGADWIAVDATQRLRPYGKGFREFMEEIQKNFSVPILGDISTLYEGICASELGVSGLSTTLSGYTPYSPQTKDPDFSLLHDLLLSTPLPIFLEGRVSSPHQVEKALKMGAHGVIVGTAITDPQRLTTRFST